MRVRTRSAHGPGHTQDSVTGSIVRWGIGVTMRTEGWKTHQVRGCEGELAKPSPAGRSVPTSV